MALGGPERMLGHEVAFTFLVQVSGKGCVRKSDLPRKPTQLISEHHLGRQQIPRRRVSENESLIFIVRMEMPRGGEWLYHTLKNLRGLADIAGCTDPRL